MAWSYIWCGLIYDMVLYMVWSYIWCGLIYDMVLYMVWSYIWCGLIYGVVLYMVYAQFSGRSLEDLISEIVINKHLCRSFEGQIYQITNYVWQYVKGAIGEGQRQIYFNLQVSCIVVYTDLNNFSTWLTCIFLW